MKLSDNQIGDLLADIIEEMDSISAASLEGATTLKAAQEALRVLSMGLVRAGEIKQMEKDAQHGRQP
jgi:glycerol dehydrogenase-like iron-containing ADH family enzyme